MTESVVRVGLVYPGLLGTYGDRGNAITLVERLRRRGHEAELVDIDAGGAVPDSLDIYLLGGGEDDSQVAAAAGLRASAGALRRARERGAVVLAVCAGFQLIGHRYEAGDGATMDGLGLVDAATVAGDDRLIGEVVVEADRNLGLPLVSGFENHGGRTTLGPDARPFGAVVVGGGNGDGVDGALGDRLVATYLHGPVLPRNPALADLLASWVVGPLEPIDDELPEALRQERLEATLHRGVRRWLDERRLARA
jgi:lipid II isoglutaminyl synthase (glutamine-hydrolysing)